MSTTKLIAAERSKRAESADRVIVQHRGRDYPMTGAAYSRLLDRVAAKVRALSAPEPPEYERARAHAFGARLADLSADEQALMTAAGWDQPPAGSAGRLEEQELLARAGWAD